jgi:hypothetical protein
MMASMLSLLDVLPRHERVDIGNGEIDVFGISGEDIAKLLERYPNALQQMANSGGKPGGIEPGLLGALVAACQRGGDAASSLLGNEIVEGRARTLGIGAQMKVLQAIGRCTFPDGVGPFLEALVSMSLTAKEATRVIIQVAQVASKDRATTSPQPPKPSEPPATQASGS